MPPNHKRDREQQVLEAFSAHTAEHTLTVLHDRSLDLVDPQPYRHLRFAANGSRMYSWDIITWPGHLATVGDIADGYTFSRVHDMVDFFEPLPTPYRINSGYWAEKLAASQRRNATEFSIEALIEAVDEDIDSCAQDWGPLADWRPDWIELMRASAHRELTEAVQFGGTITEADAAYEALRRFSYGPDELAADLPGTGRTHDSPVEVTQDFVPQYVPRTPGRHTPAPGKPAVNAFSFDRNGDAYELMSCANVYDYHLLLARHAIVRGVKLYRDYRRDLLGRR